MCIYTRLYTFDMYFTWVVMPKWIHTSTHIHKNVHIFEYTRGVSIKKTSYTQDCIHSMCTYTHDCTHLNIRGGLHKDGVIYTRHLIYTRLYTFHMCFYTHYIPHVFLHTPLTIAWDHSRCCSLCIRRRRLYGDPSHILKCVQSWVYVYLSFLHTRLMIAWVAARVVSLKMKTDFMKILICT